MLVVAKTAARFVLGLRIRTSEYLSFVAGKTGLEIGGPSGAFRDGGLMPVYRYAASIDNCAWAEQTWMHSFREGQTFHYYRQKRPGQTYIREATDLHGLGDYAFLLTSHVLEHCANPLKALQEWRRVLKPGGFLAIVVPHYRYIQDRPRGATPIAHMMEDFRANRDESDLTHVNEVIELQEFEPTDRAPTRDAKRQLLLGNATLRVMHHHCFDEHNAPKVLEAAGLSVRHMKFVRPYHLVLLATS